MDAHVISVETTEEGITARTRFEAEERARVTATNIRVAGRADFTGDGRISANGLVIEEDDTRDQDVRVCVAEMELDRGLAVPRRAVVDVRPCDDAPARRPMLFVRPTPVSSLTASDREAADDAGEQRDGDDAVAGDIRMRGGSLVVRGQRGERDGDDAELTAATAIGREAAATEAIRAFRRRDGQDREVGEIADGDVREMLGVCRRECRTRVGLASSDAQRAQAAGMERRVSSCVRECSARAGGDARPANESPRNVPTAIRTRPLTYSTNARISVGADEDSAIERANSVFEIERGARGDVRDLSVASRSVLRVAQEPNERRAGGERESLRVRGDFAAASGAVFEVDRRGARRLDASEQIDSRVIEKAAASFSRKPEQLNRIVVKVLLPADGTSDEEATLAPIFEWGERQVPSARSGRDGFERERELPTMKTPVKVCRTQTCMDATVSDIDVSDARERSRDGRICSRDGRGQCVAADDDGDVTHRFHVRMTGDDELGALWLRPARLATTAGARPLRQRFHGSLTLRRTSTLVPAAIRRALIRVVDRGQEGQPEIVDVRMREGTDRIWVRYAVEVDAGVHFDAAFTRLDMRRLFPFDATDDSDTSPATTLPEVKVCSVIPLQACGHRCGDRCGGSATTKCGRRSEAQQCQLVGDAEVDEAATSDVLDLSSNDRSAIVMFPNGRARTRESRHKSSSLTMRKASQLDLRTGHRLRVRSVHANSDEPKFRTERRDGSERDFSPTLTGEGQLDADVVVVGDHTRGTGGTSVSVDVVEMNAREVLLAPEAELSLEVGSQLSIIPHITPPRDMSDDQLRDGVNGRSKELQCRRLRGDVHADECAAGDLFYAAAAGGGTGRRRRSVEADETARATMRVRGRLIVGVDLSDDEDDDIRVGREAGDAAHSDAGALATGLNADEIKLALRSRARRCTLVCMSNSDSVRSEAACEDRCGQRVQELAQARQPTWHWRAREAARGEDLGADIVLEHAEAEMYVKKGFSAVARRLDARKSGRVVVDQDDTTDSDSSEQSPTRGAQLRFHEIVTAARAAPRFIIKRIASRSDVVVRRPALHVDSVNFATFGPVEIAIHNRDSAPRVLGRDKPILTFDRVVPSSRGRRDAHDEWDVNITCEDGDASCSSIGDVHCDAMACWIELSDEGDGTTAGPVVQSASLGAARASNPMVALAAAAVTLLLRMWA